MHKSFTDSIKARIIICMLIILILFSVIIGYYYISFRRSAQEQSELLFHQTTNEINHQVEERLNTIIQVAKSTGYYSVIQKILFSSSANEKVLNLKPARSLIATNKSSYPFIIDIFMYKDPMTHLYTDSLYSIQLQASLSYYGLDVNTQLKEAFFTNINNDSYDSSLFFYYLPVSNILYDGTFIARENDALCIFLCDMSELYSVPASTDDINTDEIIIAFIQNNKLVGINRDIEADYIEMLLDSPETAETVTYNGVKYYVSTLSLIDDAKVMSLMPVNSISATSSYAQSVLNIIILVGTLIIIVFLSVNTQNISSSLRSILREMDMLRLGSGNIRLSEPKLQEFMILTQQINKMLDRLDQSSLEEQAAREKLYQANLLQHNTEMIAYRNQINPHFLFNTMETIRSMAQYYNAEPIEQTVTAMSKMFRYSLYAESIVPLSSEIDHVQQYITLTNIRFPGFCTLKLAVTEEASGFRIPSMLLQPLIENSVKHAFNNDKKKKQHILLLKADVDASGLLYINITDNGCGMTDAELAALKIQNHAPDENIKRDKDSIGIQNIYKRIKLLNTDNKIIFSSRFGFYTKIRFILYPIQEIQP